jgi:acetate---CoA ligase (ADP-forming)
MHGLFNAESVVVVGASDSDQNFGKHVISNLVNHGYGGKIYPVGPRGGVIHGLKVYRSISELPVNAELAVIVTPARLVNEMLVQCGEKGVRWAVIITAGFRERGAEGDLLDREILETGKRFGIRLVGPNCMGLINTAKNLYTPFVEFPFSFRKGKTSIFSQSGGMGFNLAERLTMSGVGIGKIVSIGNKLDLDEADYLAFAMDDPETDFIYIYLEGFKRGRHFADLARRSSKPIILHKSNNSAVSSTIAKSHTAALAADDQIVDSVCRECGILRVHSESEAINAAKGFRLPTLKGGNLAILSRSGGNAVVAADVCAAFGFDLPPIDREILEEARKYARADVINLGNPMDLGDISLTSWPALMSKILSQKDIDGVVFIHESHMTREREASVQLIETLSKLSSQFGKPVAIVALIGYDDRICLEKSLDYPFFLDPVEAVQALAVSLQWSKANAASRVKSNTAADSTLITIPVNDIEKWFADMEQKNRQPLLHESLSLIDLTGIPAPPWSMATSMDEAVSAAIEMGFPIALKAVSPSLLHKSDRGAIALNIADADSLRNEWLRLQKVSDDVVCIVVQKMAPASRELVIGGKKDPSFGPVVLTGMGGVMVEVMKDVSRRMAPVNTDTAMEMLGELSGRRILGRFRGMLEADLKAAARILAQVSLLMHHFPQILEMDLNPVILNNDGKGALALDGRVLIDIAD